jgi:hypothetical protein
MLDIHPVGVGTLGVGVDIQDYGCRQNWREFWVLQIG